VAKASMTRPLIQIALRGCGVTILARWLASPLARCPALMSSMWM
jgi:hypothetical protein